MKANRSTRWPLWLRGWLLLLLLSAAATTSAAPPTQSDDPASIPPPETVTIAGTLQPEIGCPGQWNTGCAESMLTYSPEDDLWLATWELPAGSYEYKAALNGTWDDNYGLNAEYYGPNIPLEVTEDGPVTFWYDHKTRWVSDSINSLFVIVTGDFQDELGCAEDDQTDCYRSLLQNPAGGGVYTFVTAAIPPGEYEVTGIAPGEVQAVPFTVAEGQAVQFVYDPAVGTLEVATGDPGDLGAAANVPAGLPAPAAPKPNTVTIPGTIQSVLGCPGDWQPDCAATYLTFDEEDQLWTATFTIPAGEYEYKAALNDSWDVNFGLNAEPGGSNIPLVLDDETDVTFFFDHNTGWVADSVNNLIANVPGDFQATIGCPGDWQPDCLRTWLQDPDGDGIYTYMTDQIPQGDYEAKVAINQSWDENYGENGAPGGANIPFIVPINNTPMIFSYDSASHFLTIRALGEGAAQGNIKQQKAHWVSENTIAWDIEPAADNTYLFHYSRSGGTLQLELDSVGGGNSLPLTVDPNGLSDELKAKFPHLANFTALTIQPDDLDQVRIALKGQVAVSAHNPEGEMLDATGLQIPGVLDDLYTYDGPLGVTFDGDIPTLRLWAPTAQSVKLHLFTNSTTPGSDIRPMRIDPQTGVWTITGEPGWKGQFYLYELLVYAPSTGTIELNLVTDPYSVSLAANSTRSQIVNLNDAALMPAGWDTLEKPPLVAPEDIVVYELHIRDFSANDPTVPAEHRGKYLAFTDLESNGMEHLIRLAQAGLTHLHLLPSFDIATIEEDSSLWVDADPAELATLPANSEEQQAILNPLRDLDGFNWGYDPYHYNVPEGSYATDPTGATRILEYRQMVQSLNQNGLRVVADVVYNHTNASGQNDRSVLDKIVPGYYHRLNASGRVETSTCCQNTATEHNMMRKLMIDSAILWATVYKIDAFRFDLMGHHMKDDMIALQDALHSLTLEEDGIDGSSIYIYGEGWDFGEVGGNARGINATQFNMAGTGIGTFNDRLRDAARGGSPFGGQQEQGFINGLYTDPNATDQGTPEEQLTRLLHFGDLIRVGLAGNLMDYQFINAAGELVNGTAIDYNGNAAAYTSDPQENIIYVSKHDNETLFDIIQYKAPLETSMADRVRMQNLGNALVMFSQGIPFFQAGDDMLRSKSLDRNSYNSGDWFNRLDFSYQSNNWGVGLPPSADNQSMWPVMATLLGTEGLTPGEADIIQAVTVFRELLQIRRSSPLFRLQTAAEVQERLAFYNTGPEQIPGLIVMSLSDLAGANLDPNYGMIVVLFNATPETQSFTIADVAGLPFTLHPVQQASSDAVVQTASFNAANAAFTVPARTTAVFVLAEADTPAAAPTDEAVVATPTEPTAEPVAEPTEEGAEAPITEVTPETEAAETTEETESNSTGLLVGLGVGALALGGAAAYLARRRSSQ